MPYTINNSSGAQVTVVADGTIDSTLDIKLIGKNYAGYGEVQNENFVFLLENFANSTQPLRAIAGQMWYDSSNKKLKFYDGSKFRTTGGAEIGGLQPTGLTVGDFWWDSLNNQLYAYNGTGFTLIGPQSVGAAGTTQMISRSVLDTNSTSHAIIEAKSNGTTIFTVSADEGFTLNSVNPIDGFTNIGKGMTLTNTSFTGSTSGQTTTDHRFWGTATNAERLGGALAADFITSTNPTFNGIVTVADNSELRLGSTNYRLRIFNDISLNPTIQSLSSTLILQTTESSIAKTPLKLIGAHTLPGDNLVSDLGSSSFQFRNIYANKLVGIADQADSLTVATIRRTASVTTVVDTVPVRDGSGDLFARQFHGVAIQANYADLAEKYLPDTDYAVGTVVVIGGNAEITACAVGQRAIGVISENPAFMMNKELVGGVYVALKGRVPVSVIGAVKKGDKLVADTNGCARIWPIASNNVFAIALESSNDVGPKLIEALVL